MMRKYLMALLSLILIGVVGCSQAESSSYAVMEQISADDFTTVQLNIQAGDLEVESLEGSIIQISGELIWPNSLHFVQMGEKLVINVESSDSRDHLSLTVPAGIALEVKTFRAGIDIQGRFDELNVRSTAGNISLKEFQGDAVLWAGRGDVKVEGGEGNLVMIGEHGLLEAGGFSGSISMTSIMGTLVYHGIENDENSVKLEIDHGPVRVDFPESASQYVDVSTTSGEVACIGAGLLQTVNGCKGEIGGGTGEIRIRTVSGNVDLRVVTNIGE